MICVKVFCVFLLIGSSLEKKLPDGVCVTKLVKGKLVSVGDCKKDDGSEIANLIKESLAKKQQYNCGVTYESKCFRAVVYQTNNVSFNDAKPICKTMNGKPANIYDLKHYQLLLPYLRSLMLAGWSWFRHWTGMEYKNNQFLLSDGRTIAISTEVWYPAYPSSNASYTNVGVSVYKDPEFKFQGVFNEYPFSSTYGVICEI